MTVLVPREYQEIGTKWLDWRERGFLTDWPGMGKTLQASEALVKDLPGFVAAPSHLVGQWADFLTEQYEGRVKVGLATGTRKQRDAVLDQKADVYVCNYEMLKSYALPTGIKRIIYDESHHLRNRSANKSKAAKSFANKNPKTHVYMLSASPMWKSLDDIWMQLNILYPTIFTSYHQFVEMFFVTLDTPYGTKVLKVKKDKREELDTLIKPIKLGRTYKDVGRFLPDVIENNVIIDFSTAQQKFYDEIKYNYQVQFEDEDGQKDLIFNGAGVLHTLRQVTMGSGKVDTIKSIVEDVGKPTVIGCWYRDHAEMVQKALDNCVLITGDMNAQARQQLALRAQNNDWHIAATEASICEGVNLYKYKHIIMAEEHWPPGANYQFISRVVRDRNDNGQDQDPVIINYVMVRRSVDTAIHDIAKRRQNSIKDVISESLV